MDKERRYIVWLNDILPIQASSRLIYTFGTAEDVWWADKNELILSGAITERNADKLFESKNKYSFDYIEESLEKLGARVIVQGDEEYPSRLREIDNAPIVLYALGRLPDNDAPCVSVVGSRQVDSYGAVCCEKLSKELAQAGVVIVSGLAMGTDAIAHRAALDAGGKTIAVMGTGIDKCYPATNENLHKQICDKGCVLSEFPLGTEPLAYNFPIRNRIVSGLSDITLVIEARERSGTAITARLALEQGRKLMAVPGNINSKLSAGTNLLIKSGAELVTNTSDILKMLGINSDKLLKKEKKTKITLDSDEKKVYDCVDCNPISIDEIAVKTGKNIQDISYALTMLELKGMVKKLSGQRYIRSM